MKLMLKNIYSWRFVIFWSFCGEATQPNRETYPNGEQGEEDEVDRMPIAKTTLLRNIR